MLNTAVEVLKHHHPVATPWRVQVSGLMGLTLLACWIVLLVPQLIEQWRLKSADGIAIGFITIWFTGDIFNLVGAVWAHLLPEVIFLAIWFCIADTLMVASYVYYSKIYPKHHHHSHHHRAELDETEPLIQGTRRRRSLTLTDIAIDPSLHLVFTKYVLPMLFVLAAGSAGYFLLDAPPVSDDPEPIVIGPQIMGYVSAILYLGARIPQIIQNHRRRLVDGLSLLFFLFSTLGNLTYAGQILFYRSDHQYIMLNMPWLLGSLGTIAEDLIIFAQFYMYRNHHTVIE